MQQQVTKIVVVSCMPPDSKTGVSTYCHMLCRHIRDFEMQLLTIADAPFVLRKLMGLFLQVMFLLQPKEKVFYVLRYYRILLEAALRKQLRESRGIAFHAQDPVSAFVVRGLFPQHRIITTCHYNDDPVKEFELMYGLGRQAVRRLRMLYNGYFAASDEYICVSAYVREKSKSFMPANARITVVYNATDFEKIRRERRPKKEGRLVIANCGTLEKRKNQGLLIELAKNLRDSGLDDFEIWLIGTGGSEKEYKDLIARYGLEQHVVLKGYVEEPWKLISEAHLYLHTAMNESFGYAIVEAIAAGTYALGLDAGGVPEVLGKKAVVPVEQAETCFKELLTVTPNYEFESRAADQYAEAKRRFDVSIWAETIAALYRNEPHNKGKFFQSAFIHQNLNSPGYHGQV